MINFKESSKNGYSPLKNFSKYYVNTEKGIIINKTDKKLGYIVEGGSNYIVNLKNNDGKLCFVYINELVYNQENATPLDRKKYYIKHIDGDHKNCAYDNLKLVRKGRKKQNRVGVKIENMKTGETETYKSFSECYRETGISSYYLKKHLITLEEEEVIRKDKDGIKFRITLHSEYIDCDHSDDSDYISGVKMWKI